MATHYSESKGFGLGPLTNSRFTSESTPTESAYPTDKFSSISTGTRPIITEDVEIKGELAFSGELEFNGRFEGQLKSGGTLTVGEPAMIKGSVNAESVVIAGKIQGDITASNRIHLRPEAMVIGNIKAKLIVIEEGALVDGKIIITDADRPAPDFENIFTRVSSGTSKNPSSKASHTSSSSSISAVSAS